MGALKADVAFRPLIPLNRVRTRWSVKPRGMEEFLKRLMQDPNGCLFRVKKRSRSKVKRHVGLALKSRLELDLAARQHWATTKLMRCSKQRRAGYPYPHVHRTGGGL